MGWKNKEVFAKLSVFIHKVPRSQKTNGTLKSRRKRLIPLSSRVCLKNRVSDIWNVPPFHFYKQIYSGMRNHYHRQWKVAYNFEMKRGIRYRRHSFVGNPSDNNLAKFQPNWSRGFRLVARSRLSVSGDDRKSERGKSGIWPGEKKIGEGAGMRACKHCFKNLISPTLKKKTLQGCRMSKCRHLRCRVTRVFITTSQHVLIFLQSLNMSSLSTKISSNIDAFHTKCCTRFCQNLRYFQENYRTSKRRRCEHR